MNLVIKFASIPVRSQCFGNSWVCFRVLLKALVSMIFVLVLVITLIRMMIGFHLSSSERSSYLRTTYEKHSEKYVTRRVMCRKELYAFHNIIATHIILKLKVTIFNIKFIYLIWGSKHTIKLGHLCGKYVTPLEF